MKVILLQELKGKGGEGDVVDVAHGFAVNYLFPNRIAVEATKGELKQLEQRRHNIEKRELARTTDAATLKEALEGKTIIVPAKVGEEGQLFGSVTTAIIADAVSEQIGVTVDRKKVDLGKAIKMAGDHIITISIYRDIRATITVKVVSDEEDIEMMQEALNAVAGIEDEAVSGEAEAASEDTTTQDQEVLADSADEAITDPANAESDVQDESTTTEIVE